MTNSSPWLVIKNGTLIDGSGRDPIANSLIVVEETGSAMSAMPKNRCGR